MKVKKYAGYAIAAAIVLLVLLTFVVTNANLGKTPVADPTTTPIVTAVPTEEPTEAPTTEPTPTAEPTATPTEAPTATPTEEPTATPEPTEPPTRELTLSLVGFAQKEVTVTITVDADGVILAMTVDASKQTVMFRNGMTEEWLAQFIGQKGPFALEETDSYIVVDGISHATTTTQTVLDALNQMLFGE